MALHTLNTTKLLDEVNERWPTVLTAVFVLTGALIYQIFLKSDPLSGIPIVGKGGKHKRRKLFVSGGARELYLEGYRKVCGVLMSPFEHWRLTESQFKEGVFRITTARGTYLHLDVKSSKRQC